MRRIVLVAVALLLLMGGAVSSATGQSGGPSTDAVPRAECGPGSVPETGAQGRITEEQAAAGGFQCNLEELSHFGTSGGYKVHRYIDSQGVECAFYDSTLLFPTGVPEAGPEGPGVYVLDMTDPANPVKTANLVTPAMLSPHESLFLNEARGLLVADMGYPTFNPGFVDIYSVADDCRQPELLSSTPLGILGHESGFSPDGNTFWATSTGGQTITALDITDPALPVPLWVGTSWSAHGVRVSADGNRLYVADTGDGLHILDISEVQARVQNPTVTEISALTWPELSIPQAAIPFSVDGHPYLVEIDEFGAPSGPVGAARIIDIADERSPRVVSNIRLEVHSPEAQAGEQSADPGATSPLSGYTGHYCSVPREEDPGIVACGMILSGLRVFDIRDPLRPREIAYWNHPAEPTIPGDAPTSYAMDAPAFVPERGEIWHADGNSGFHVLRFTNGVWPFDAASAPAQPSSPATTVVAPAPSDTLPATGGRAVFGIAGMVLLAVALATTVSRLGGRGRA